MTSDLFSQARKKGRCSFKRELLAGPPPSSAFTMVYPATEVTGMPVTHLALLLSLLMICNKHFQETLLCTGQHLAPVSFWVTVRISIFYDLLSENTNPRVLILPLISFRFSAGTHVPFLQDLSITSKAFPMDFLLHSRCPIDMCTIPGNTIKTSNARNY